MYWAVLFYPSQNATVSSAASTPMAVQNMNESSQCLLSVAALPHCEGKDPCGNSPWDTNVEAYVAFVDLRSPTVFEQPAKDSRYYRDSRGDGDHGERVEASGFLLNGRTICISRRATRSVWIGVFRQGQSVAVRDWIGQAA